jgi:hypothetical protein
MNMSDRSSVCRYLEMGCVIGVRVGIISIPLWYSSAVCARAGAVKGHSRRKSGVAGRLP